jgi:hypothetical protein
VGASIVEEEVEEEEYGVKQEQAHSEDEDEPSYRKGKRIVS